MVVASCEPTSGTSLLIPGMKKICFTGSGGEFRCDPGIENPLESLVPGGNSGLTPELDEASSPPFLLHHLPPSSPPFPVCSRPEATTASLSPQSRTTTSPPSPFLSLHRRSLCLLLHHALPSPRSRSSLFQFLRPPLHQASRTTPKSSSIAIQPPSEPSSQRRRHLFSSFFATRDPLQSTSVASPGLTTASLLQDPFCSARNCCRKSLPEVQKPQPDIAVQPPKRSNPNSHDPFQDPDPTQDPIGGSACHSLLHSLRDTCPF